MPSLDLDDASLDRLARSFYVVKMARYAALVVAALGVAALATSQDAPLWVPVVLVVVAVLVVAAAVVTRVRYVSARRRAAAAASASSPSPRG